MTGQSEIIAGKRIVFLVGAPRSGTTWLQLMLARSAQVATVNETHLFDVYLRSLLDGHRSFSRDLRTIGLSPLFSEAEYLDILRTLASTVLVRILGTKPEATVILEKTPSHVRVWRDILKVFPNACFLHIVRDPRAVVASLNAARKSWGRDWIASMLVDNCAMWSASVRDGRAIAAATKNYFEIRYEDLRSDAAKKLLAIFHWMDVQSSLDECLQIVRDTDIEKLRSGEITNAPWAMSSEPQGFYREGKADAWRQELSERETFVVESVTKELMAALAYRQETKSRPSLRMAAIAQVAVFNRLRAGLGWRASRLAATLSPPL